MITPSGRNPDLASSSQVDGRWQGDFGVRLMKIIKRIDYDLINNDRNAALRRIQGSQLKSLPEREAVSAGALKGQPKRRGEMAIFVDGIGSSTASDRTLGLRPPSDSAFNAALNKTEKPVAPAPEFHKGMPAPITGANVVAAMQAGFSLDLIAAGYGVSRQDLIDRLEQEGIAVDVTAEDGGVEVTEITRAVRDGVTVADDRSVTEYTVTEYYDHEHDTYHIHTKISDRDSNRTPTLRQETSTPTRDGLGRKETSSKDPVSGAMTTRYEDDLRSGDVVEETRWPVSSQMGWPAGLELQVTTSKDGKKHAVFTDASGHQLVLLDEKGWRPETGQAVRQAIFRDGKTVPQVMQERGMSEADVLTSLQVAGVRVEQTKPAGGNGDVATLTLFDPASNGLVIETNDYQHDGFQHTAIAGSPDSVSQLDPRPGGPRLPGGLGYLQQLADGQRDKVAGYNQQIEELAATIRQDKHTGGPVEEHQKQLEDLERRRDLAQLDADVSQAKLETAYMARRLFEAGQQAMALQGQAAAGPGPATAQLEGALILADGIEHALAATDVHLQLLELEQVLAGVR
jgi:hypothetical protein